MKCPVQNRLTCAGSRCRWRQVAAFTLVELLVVIAIIALLTAVSLPALKGFGKGTGMLGAQRQLLQDLGLARLSAINGRTTVYMVFVPTNILQVPFTNDQKVLRQLTNLVSGQYTAYALVTKRSVGDQPGQESPRYISEWKWLPQGILIETNKFSQWNPYLASYPLDYRRPFATNVFPFPSRKGIPWTLPCVAFNSQGQLASGRDELIPLAEGSIFFNGGVPDVVIKPPYNYTNHFIRINWLTGRASVDEATRPKFY
jgi:prepilin-type N-terminal cleavage/methylation domain-containing protein